MAERLLSKCLNFQRTVDGIWDKQLCKAVNEEVKCAGWSDGCEYPVFFRSAEHLPREKIEFNKLEERRD